MKDVRQQLWKQVYLDNLEKRGSLVAASMAKEAVERYAEMFGKESDEPEKQEPTEEAIFVCTRVFDPPCPDECADRRCSRKPPAACLHRSELTFFRKR